MFGLDLKSQTSCRSDVSELNELYFLVRTLSTENLLSDSGGANRNGALGRPLFKAITHTEHTRFVPNKFFDLTFFKGLFTLEL